MANRVFPYIKTAAPTVNDDTGDGYKVGDMWLDTTNDITYQAIDVTLGAAVWIKYLGRMATSRLIGRTTASTGNWEEITVGSGLSLSAGSLTATGGSGGDKYPMEFRLSLETGVPVSTSDQTAKTTIYCTPYKGNQIALYDGVSAWTTYTSAQFSLALGTLTSGLPYDVFCYNNSGTPTLEFLAWTNGTTRATALTTQDGIYVKSGATTRRYIGTFYTTSTTTTEDSDTHRYIYNYYNRVNRRVYKHPTTAHTYATAAWRYWNNDTSNKVEFIIGLLEDSITMQAQGDLDPSAAGVVGILAAGLNTTSGAGQPVFRNDNAETVVAATIGMGIPSLGYNYLALLEYSSGATMNFNFGEVAAILSM